MVSRVSGQINQFVGPLSHVKKGIALAIGGVAGYEISQAIDKHLPSPEDARELNERGLDVMSNREARATFAPVSFVASAAVGAGIAKRSETAAVTTASLGAAAMLASTATTAMTRAGEDSAENYLRTLGMMGVVAAGAYAIGAVDEVPLKVSKLAGLGMLGFAAGMFLPETHRFLEDFPERFSRSTQYGSGRL